MEGRKGEAAFQQNLFSSGELPLASSNFYLFSVISSILFSRIPLHRSYGNWIARRSERTVENASGIQFGNAEKTTTLLPLINSPPSWLRTSRLECWGKWTLSFFSSIDARSSVCYVCQCSKSSILNAVVVECLIVWMLMSNPVLLFSSPLEGLMLCFPLLSFRLSVSDVTLFFDSLARKSSIQLIRPPSRLQSNDHILHCCFASPPSLFLMMMMMITSISLPSDKMQCIVVFGQPFIHCNHYRTCATFAAEP